MLAAENPILFALFSLLISIVLAILLDTLFYKDES